MSDRKPTWVCRLCGATYGSKGKGKCTQLKELPPIYGSRDWTRVYSGTCGGLLVRDVELTEEDLDSQCDPIVVCQMSKVMEGIS